MAVAAKAKAFVKAKAKANAAGKAVAKAKAKAAGKAVAKAKAKAAGKAAARAVAAKAKAKAFGKAKAKAVGKAKAKAKAAAAAQLPLFIVTGSMNAAAPVVSVSTADTLDNIMEQIQEQEGIPHDQQRFVVEDARFLSDYRLRVGLEPASVAVETPAGTLWIEARELFDFDKIRVAVQDSVGIPPDRQVLSVCANGNVIVTIG
jgi:hypothetical protein